MVKVKCSVPNCQFETDDASEALVIAILANHGLAHQNSQPVSTAQAPVAPRGPKLERPKVDIGVTTEGWNVFVRRWDVFPEWIRDRRGISPLPAFSMCRGPSSATAF